MASAQQAWEPQLSRPGSLSLAELAASAQQAWQPQPSRSGSLSLAVLPAPAQQTWQPERSRREGSLACGESGSCCEARSGQILVSYSASSALGCAFGSLTAAVEDEQPAVV